MKKVYQKYATLFCLWFGSRFARRFSGDCYQNIDTLPIFYWIKVQETGNYSYLIRTKNVHIEKKKPGKIRSVALGIHWRKLLDEYIERFGFSDNLWDVINKEKEIALLKVDKIVNNNKSLNAFIRIAESELSELNKYSTGGDFWQIKSVVEKEMGFTINPYICTVMEFYSYIKEMEKQARKANNT